ncbi:MAG TPA: lipid II flippase MurJ [Candidatus Paceibacterota bacterium]|nr:lipid II flippase MurJ [Candidatus Paceibacterota bacterium]
MVRGFFERFATPIRGLHQAAYVLASLTLASQALALLRDRTFASVFGASPTLDLYYAAFRIPDLVFALVASLVSAYVLIPRIAAGTTEETKKLLSESVSFLLMAGGAICILLGIFMPQLLAAAYPDLAASPDASSFIMLARLLLVQPLVLGVSGIVTSVTQVHRKFVLFALSPVLYNVGIMFGTLVLYPQYGLTGIGTGVLVGALLHVAIHIPVLARAGVLPRLVVPRLSELLPIMRDSIPRSLALGMGSVTAFILTACAVKVGTGSVSVFTLAGNLEAVPLSLIGASYAVAAFPALSEASSGDNKAEFTRILSASARHLIVWSLVALGLIVVLRAHLVRVILGSGAFDWNATRLTAAMLAIFTIGLVAQGLVLLFSRALYAARQSWRPLMYQILGGVVTVGLALSFLTLAGEGFPAWLAGVFRVAHVPGSGILLIALAATIGQIFLALLSLVALSQTAPGITALLGRPFVHGAFAAAAGGSAAYGTLALLGGIVSLTTLPAVFTQGLLAGMVGLTASAVTLRLFKNEEFSDGARALARLPGIRTILPPSAEEPAQP